MYFLYNKQYDELTNWRTSWRNTLDAVTMTECSLKKIYRK